MYRNSKTSQVMKNVSFVITEDEAIALSQLAQEKLTTVSKLVASLVRGQLTSIATPAPTPQASVTSVVKPSTNRVANTPAATASALVKKSPYEGLHLSKVQKEEVPAYQWFRDKGLDPKKYKMELFTETYEELEQTYGREPKSMSLDFALKR